MKPYSYSADFYDPCWDRPDPLVEPRDVEGDDSDREDFIPLPWPVCDDNDNSILF